MRLRKKLVGFLFVLIAGVSFAIQHSRVLSNGPQAVVWDRENCAGCHMLISDKRFAAQLQAADGSVRNFDDPGCLMLFVARMQPKVRAIYFRDSQSDKWLLAGDAAFLRSAGTPMGYGLAATEKNAPGAMPYEQAAKEIR